MEVELKDEDIKRLNNKLTKDTERREKTLLERKKVIEEQ
jgi:hypothetical protein